MGRRLDGGALLIMLATISRMMGHGAAAGQQAFTSSGIYTVPTGVRSVKVLVVAGGGGGGGNEPGAGGGAGGLILNPAYLVIPGQGIAVTVGSMGAAGGLDMGGDGGNSIFGDLVAIGGGGGAATYNNGRPGGSGGGAAAHLGVTRTGGLGTAGQGCNGGNASAPSGYNYSTGGGGGAGAVGQSTSGGDVGGIGGDGLNQVTISAVVYNFAALFGIIYGHIISDQAWFAGGGGGGRWPSSPAGAGGKGGGGAGSAGGTGVAGTPNTGGGGGGGYYGGAGGSGIVIVKWG